MGDIRAKGVFVAAFAEPLQADLFKLVFGDHSIEFYVNFSHYLTDHTETTPRFS